MPVRLHLCITHKHIAAAQISDDVAAQPAELEVDVGLGVVVAHLAHAVLRSDELEHHVAHAARPRQLALQQPRLVLREIGRASCRESE